MYHFFQGPNVVMVLFEKSFLIHWGFCSFLTILWCAWSLLLSLMEIKMSFPFPCIHIANCPRATYRQPPSALGGSAYTARQQGPSVAGLVSVTCFSSFVLLQYRGGLATIYSLKISVHLQQGPLLCGQPSPLLYKFLNFIFKNPHCWNFCYSYIDTGLQVRGRARLIQENWHL